MSTRRAETLVGRQGRNVIACVASVLRRAALRLARARQWRNLAVFACLCIFLQSPALAVLPGCGEGTPEPVPIAPPVQETNRFAVSPGHVDMRTGALTYSQVDLSIGGEGDAGLSLKRSLQLNSERMDLPMGTYFTHNWDIQLREERQPVRGACYPSEYDYIETVTFEGLGESFFAYGAGTSIIFEQTGPSGYATLEFAAGGSTPSKFTFTASDGTVVEFLQMQPKATSMCKGDKLGRCAYASRVTRPDGTVYDLAYETLSDGHTKRLKSVTSNRGFALLFQHASDNRRVTKACAINLTVQVMPSNGLCPAGVPTATYSYSGEVQTSATDAGSSVSQFSINTTAQTYSLHRAGDASAYVTGQYALIGESGDREKLKATTHQTFIDGRTFDYEWEVITNSTFVPLNADGGGYWMVTQVIVGSNWDDGHGDRVELVYGRYANSTGPFASNALLPTRGPERVTDQIDRETNYVFCSGNWGDYCPSGAHLAAVIAPEGNAKAFAYDYYWRLTGTTSTPKSGTGSLVTSTGYPSLSACSASVLICNKPTSTTDARGNVTDYTYDATHGGVLTVTGPADANAVQPQTRYQYAQYYAQIKTGGGYAKAATPVWLLASEDVCQTSAWTGSACAAGAADRVVISYEYGPQETSPTQPNNLWLRGKVVTADGVSLRTCYGYDSYGRVIAETSPNANLSSCS